MTFATPHSLKKKLWAGTLALVMGASLAAPTVSARTLNYSTPSPPTDRPTNEALRWWANEVKERTNGSVEIKIHWLQSLVKFKDAMRGIQAGIADMGPISPEYSLARNPLLALSQTDLGSGDNYIATEAWRRAIEGFEPLLQETENNGLKLIGYTSSGFRVNLSATRPYLTPADFQGDKVRLTTRAVSAAAINDWDVTPVNLTFTDLYSSMERGTLDGAQSYLYLTVPYKHNEVSDYVVETGIGQSMVTTMMNLHTWNSLTDEERQVFEELKPELMERMALAGLQESAYARNVLKTHPKYAVEYHVLNDEQRQIWEEEYTPAVEAYVDEIAARNAAAPELHNRLQAALDEVEQEVREQGYPWERD